jgi:hypothetical protein
MKTKTYKNKTLCAGRVCRNIHTGMIPLKRIITSFHKRVKRSRKFNFKRFYITSNLILGNPLYDFLNVFKRQRRIIKLSNVRCAKINHSKYGQINGKLFGHNVV